VCCLLQRKIEEEKEMGGDEGCLSGYKLNIIHGFTGGFKSIGNFVCKNDTPSCFLAYFFSFFPFPIVIL
jgi:hypothetical protein